MTGRTELHSCQGNVNELFNRDNVTESIAVPYARRHGNAFIFQDDNARAHRARVVQDHLQFRKITTLLWPRSPQTCLQLNACGTFSGTYPETASQATGHQRARRCTPGRMAPDSPSKNWAAYQEHEASLSRVLGGEWRPFCEIDTLNLSKLQVKFKSRDLLNFVVDDKYVV